MNVLQSVSANNGRFGFEIGAQPAEIMVGQSAVSRNQDGVSGGTSPVAVFSYGDNYTQGFNFSGAPSPIPKF
jgi:hypothetical protein